MVMPSSQWFGNGLGHMGSTSNRGACTPAASTAARLWSSVEPTPSAMRSAEKASPRYRLRFIFLLPFQSLDHALNCALNCLRRELEPAACRPRRVQRADAPG